MKKNIFACFFVCLFSLLFLSVDYIFINLTYPIKYYDTVSKYCNEFKIEPVLVFSVIKTESDFNISAKSKVGAIGLMQLMPLTAKFIADKIGFNEEINLENYETNIHLGIAYLSYLFNRFAYENVVICAYNAGEGVVSKWLNEQGNLKEIEFEETKNYLSKVLYAKQVYKNRLSKYGV